MEAAENRAGRSYLRAAFAVRPELADEAAAILIAHGALGCAVRARRDARRAGLERWEDDAPPTAAARDGTRTLDAFFTGLDPRRLAAISRTLSVAGLIDQTRTPRLERIVDPGWATRWKHRFRPLAVGRRLLIAPPWSKARSGTRMRLVINPAQAFGTGHHGSTAGALVMLERLCRKHRFRNALDAGCGSGILAIAMRMYGVPRVLAVDNDRAALVNARENLALNRIDGVRCSGARLQSLRRRFDLIAANILSATLIELAPALARLLNPGARLLLGGILTRERAAVLRAFRPRLALEDELVRRGWLTLAMRR